MKIYINHSFLFNIDSMLRCFSSEIDQMWSGEIDQMWSKCGEYKQLFILQLVFFIYFVYCISIMRVILNKAVTKKKSCTWGAAECVTQGGERGRLIYIYRGGGSLHFMQTNNPNKCPKNNNQCFGDGHILFRVERGYSLSTRNLGGGYQEESVIIPKEITYLWTNAGFKSHVRM